jgi:hypothetical protein
VYSKLNKIAEFASSLYAPKSATLSRPQLFSVRVGWLVVFVLTLGLFSASVPAHYDWLVSFADPELDPTAVRAGLAANGISIDFYATYLLSVDVAQAMVWCAVGVVIFWRRSDDWMAVFTSLCLIIFGTFTLADVPMALAEQYSALWLLIHLIGFFGSTSLVLFFFLFPDGRFVPRWSRWIPIFWAAHEAAYYFLPNSVFNIDRSFPMLDFVTISTFLCIGIGSQVYRYRRVSGPVQRQQTKWVVFGIVSAVLGAIGFASPLYSVPTFDEYGSLLTFVFEAGMVGSFCLIPLSIGVALVHDRLWDVDIIINRTLIYGALTVSLALLYFGGIVVLQRVFVVLTGQKSTLAVVASTLLIAALFNPLRRRMRAFIDKRFYRRKYDARKTLEAFSTKLRDEADLNALSDDLVGVVAETMQPAHVSLWLRPDTPQRRMR